MRRQLFLFHRHGLNLRELTSGSTSASLSPASPFSFLSLLPLYHSAVHLVGHYIRQEDFDEPPSSDEEYDSDDFDSEDGDEDISGLIDMDDEEMEEAAARIQEIEEQPKPCVVLSCSRFFVLSARFRAIR